jgi:YHS domain-containing protein
MGDLCHAIPERPVFLLWAGLFFLMMRFGCGAHVAGHWHRHSGSRRAEGHNPADSRQWQLPARDVDPVCGKMVDTATAKSTVYRGRAYYFCSQECREKFEAAPASYVKVVTGAFQSRENHHGHC